jgi:uncharacterized membrane protein YraQ (UPF0718 family)
MKNIPSIWKFLLLVLVLYFGIFIFYPDIILECFDKFLFLLKKIAGSFFLVFIFMYLFNVFISEKLIKKHLQGEIKLKHYLIVAFVGILSTGPIYLWFAHLSRLKDQGMDDGLISLFLYNRAIKLPLIPLMIQYFSIKITIIISCLILIFSFLNAFLIHYFLKTNSHKNRNCVHG